MGRSITVCLAFIFALLSAGLLYAAGGDIVWQVGDSQSAKQQATASAVDSAGNVIVTGYQNLAGGTDDNYWTVKFKADGSGVAWRAVFDKAGGTDQAMAVAVDANNDVIVTGFVWNGLNKDIHTIKYDGASGAVVWQQTYNGAAGGNDVGTAVAVDSLNNIYVAGTSQNGSGNDDIVILKYAPTDGNPVWQTTYNGTANGNEQALSIAAGLDGIAVTGQSWNGTAFDMLTVKYDFTGTKLWEARHSSAGGGLGKKVKLDAGGNVVATGYAAGSANKDIYTAKYNGATGAVLWEKIFDGGYDDEANDLYVDAVGEVYITGYTWTLTGNEDFYTARYSGSNGNLVWQNSFNSGTNSDIATAIAGDEAGDVYVTGYTVTGGNYDFQTLKYKRDNGSQLWQRSFNGAANKNDRPVGIGITATGSVVVAGWSDNGSDLDYYVINYDPGLLNAPTNLTATTQTDTSIQLAWVDNSANEDGFKIERKMGESGTYAEIATVGPNTTGYTDPAAGLVANNYYYYRVRSFNAVNGNSHYSNEAHALTVYVTVTPPTWSYLYGNPDSMDDYANGIAVGPDNNPVVTGYSQRTVGGFDYYTIKLNRADQSIIWSDLYDDVDSEMDVAKCVAVDGNNNAIVSGFSQLFYAPAQKNINSIYTIKYPVTGPPMTWGAQYNGPGAIDDRATAIATTTDAGNNIVVIGYGKNAANNDDIYVVKYNADGSRAWAATPYDGAGQGDDIPSAVAIAPDGSVYVTGYSETGPGTGIYNLFTAKYNGTSGALIWADVYSVISGGDNRGNGIAVDSAGDVYVTGTATTVSGSKDLYTIKYSGTAGTAQRVWERSFDGTAHGDDEGIGIKVDPIDGNIVVAGTSLTNAGDHDITLIRYTAAGDQVWQKTLQRPANDDIATTLAMDSSGYLYVAGNTSNGATMDIISLIYDFEGTFLGATVYNGAANGNDEASAIAVNYKGEAFIAGYSTTAAGDADYVVVKQTNGYILVPAPFVATPQADYGKINLTWGDNTSGTQFTIERTLGPVTGGSIWSPIAVNLVAGSTSYQDTGLNPNTSYCYRIEAHSGSLISRKIITCATTTVPTPAVNQLSVVSTTAIDISWANVANNTGYKLERSLNNSSWAQIGGNLAANTVLYHDTGLTAGSVYYYRVSSLNGSGASVPSSVQIAPVLNALSGITSAKVDLSWPAVTGITGYIIERSVDNSNWSQIATPAAAATTYSDTTVASGTLYYYRLRAVSASGTSGPSLVQSGVIKLKTPAFSSAAGSSTTAIGLVWTDPNNNESGYTVEYAACSSSYDNPTTCASYISYDWAWGAWTPVTYGANTTTATIGSLTPGRTYRFRVTATVTGGNSDPSAMTTATANLVGPTNLTATAATESSVTLAWSDILGETNYKVEQDGVILAGVTLGQNTASYTVTGLTLNTPYCFRVQPYNATSSAFSNQACVTLYGAPTLNTVTATSQTQIALAWSDIAGETGFEVWQSVASTPSSPPTSPTTGSWNAYTNLTPTALAAGTTSYTVSTGLTAGYTYKYKIRYKLPDGSFSAYSNELMATTIPSTPSTYTSGVTTTQITLNWYNVYGDTGYNAQVKARAGANCTTEDWTGVTSNLVGASTLSYVATGLTAGTTYCFRVNAVNAAGASPWSSAITQTTLLPAPTLNALTGVTQSQITLSWSDVTGNNGYRIERSTDNVSWSQIATTAVNIATYTNTVLAPNQIYYYRVSTINSAGAYSSPASNVQSATTQAVPSPTLNTLSGITTTQITLTWGDVSGNAGYKVERSTDNSTWSQIATPTTGAVSYTDTGLTAGALYYYRVSTKNSVGGLSTPSNVQSATTTPAAPVVTLNLVSEARIDLTWQVVLGATNYKVLRSIGASGPWTQITNQAVAYATLYCGLYTTPTIGCPTLVPVSSSYADTGLTENTQYCYQLQAWNATGGDSAASATVCQKTPAVGGPVLSAVTAVNSLKIQLTWSYNPASCSPNPCDTPDGFEIWRQLWNGEWTLMATIPNVTTYTDSTGIEPQKGYSYKVRAYKGADTSAFSSAKGVTTPAYVDGDNTCP